MEAPPPLDEGGFVSDMACVCAFLGWIEPGTLRGGHKIEEVKAAFARLSGLTVEQIDQVARPKNRD